MHLMGSCSYKTFTLNTLTTREYNIKEQNENVTNHIGMSSNKPQQNCTGVLHKNALLAMLWTSEFDESTLSCWATTIKLEYQMSA